MLPPRSGKIPSDWSLLEIEEFILKLCWDLAAEKKKILINRLYNRTRREIGAPRVKIETAIENLIKERKIIAEKFLHKENVLENTTRKEIYDLICSKPSFLAYTIKQILNLGEKQVSWHLKQLLDFRLISQATIGKKTIFFDATRNESEAVLYFIIIKSPEIRDLLSKLMQSPVTKNVLFDQTSLARSTLYYHIKRLEQASVLKINGSGAGQELQINPQYKINLSKILETYKTP